MLFKNCEYFLAIVETGSISKAAERLYISQPSLSKYLKRLEENVGEALFSRERYPLRLTAAGEAYLSYVQEVAKQETRLRKELSYLRHEERGAVALGITPWRSSILLPRVLPLFRQRYPGIAVTVQEGSHQHMHALLERGKADFALLHMPNRYQGLTFEHLQFERLLFAVNRNHPALPLLHGAGAGGVGHIGGREFALFSEAGFILLKQGQNIREIAENYLNKQGIAPEVLLETSNIITALNLVKAGMGVTFVPETLRGPGEKDGELRFFTVDDPPLRWEVGAAYRSGMPLSRPARRLLECIRESLSGQPG